MDLRAGWLALAVLSACGGDDASPHTHPLWSDGTYLRDTDGRVALLRGINARVEGVFDVTFADGRVALEPIPPLRPDDCARMRALGFDLLRLPINWSAIEPVRGTYDEAYLARVDTAITCAGNAGMVVLVDLHQDAYSKEIGEDGAPLWAIQPAPAMLLQGPLDDLTARRVSSQVQDAFRTFFAVDDGAGLQADFARMLEHVATRWADHPAVLGFELFNEPDTGSAELDAFHERAARAVRGTAPDKLVLFESPAVRNLTDFVPKAKAPFPVDGAVYAPHIYTHVFSPDQTAFQNATADELEVSVSLARDEATAWHTPLLIGEYGVAPIDDPAHVLWMQTQGQLHDRYFASDAFWVWKEQSQGSWGIFDYDAPTATWSERPLVVSWISRLRVARIAGTPMSLESTPAGDAVRLTLAPGSQTAAPNLVYIPERFAGSTTIRCDGAVIAAARDATTGLAAVSCSGVLEAQAQ